MAWLYSKAHIRESLQPHPSGPDEDMLWLAGGSYEKLARLAAAAPSERTPAAVLVPLVQRQSGWTVLLTQRAATLKDHAGQISFPGGRIDPQDADAWRAALREAHEEIGLDPSFVTVAGLSSTYQTRTGYDITPVVGFVRPGFHLTPNPDEVADVFEVPFAFLMEPGNHERQFRDQADGMRRYFYAMSYEDRVIWGATAGMVRVLYERLYGEAAKV
jgi:8-oxo-dGTP pyrophosphatase MutT (NUDIX family)